MARKTPTRPQNRWDDIIVSERTAKRRPPHRRARKTLVFVTTLLAILAVLIAGVLAWAQLKLKANSQELAELSARGSSEPMNVLVLGSDSRDVLSPEELERFDPTGVDRGTGQRADTIILIHIDPGREQAVVIHFPRDLRVADPEDNFGKINGIYQRGPGAMIQTVQGFTGVPVHHYVEMNFVGFRNIVDALGGVEVHFERPIEDPDSGLNVPAGCVELGGDQALAFVRVRKVDDDFGRIRRQQLFLSLMMERIASARTLVDIPRVIRLVNLFSENVTSDANLSLGDVKNLALRLRSFDPQRVDMRVVPSSPKTIGRISYVVAHEEEASALFQALREGAPLPDYGRTGVSPINPAEVRVAVLNGTSVSGLATKAAEELGGEGFVITGRPTNADRNDYQKTTVFFKEGFHLQADLVAARYGAEVKPLPDTIGSEAEVVLVVGQDYDEQEDAPPPPPPGPEDSEAKQPLVHRCDG